MPYPINGGPNRRALDISGQLARLGLHSDRPGDQREPLEAPLVDGRAAIALSQQMVGGEGNALVEHARAHPVQPSHLPLPADAQPLRYKRLYDSHQTAGDAWMVGSDGIAIGTFLPGFNVFLGSPVYATQLAPINLSQFPGAISVLIAITSFSFYPSASTMSGKFLSVYFVDTGGGVTDFGTLNGNGVGWQFIRTALTHTKLTDPGNPTPLLGTIYASSGFATPVACNFTMGLAFAYELPALDPYPSDAHGQSSHGMVTHPLRSLPVWED